MLLGMEHRCPIWDAIKDSRYWKIKVLIKILVESIQGFWFYLAFALQRRHNKEDESQHKTVEFKRASSWFVPRTLMQTWLACLSRACCFGHLIEDMDLCKTLGFNLWRDLEWFARLHLILNFVCTLLDLYEHNITLSYFSMPSLVMHSTSA